MIMNLELLKGKQYPYIIRFTEAGIQHITTNGTVMGVVNVPCTHDCDTGGIIGISDVDNDTFKLIDHVLLNLQNIPNSIRHKAFHIIALYYKS